MRVRAERVQEEEEGMEGTGTTSAEGRKAQRRSITIGQTAKCCES